MLKLVEEIKQSGLENVCLKYFITAKRHSEYPNLVLLKYDQINSDPKLEAVRQARGIILDEDNDWNIVCYSYERFANYGEGWAVEIDWMNARAYEKLDGSLMQLYYYDNKWQVASSGLPDAAGQVNGFDKSFAELFWETWNKLNYKLPIDTNKCYAFELMTKYNRVVVKHEEPRIVLHGARRLSDFKELNPVIEAHNNGWECVKIFPLNTIEEILETANALDPMKSEGFVVCDKDFNRLKVKSASYVAMSHLRESVGMSGRQLVEIIRRNESSEFLQYFPEFADNFYDIRAKFERLIGQIEGFIEATRHIDNRKEFALLAKKVKYSSVLFLVKFNNETIKHCLASLPIKTLENLLELKTEEV